MKFILHRVILCAVLFNSTKSIALKENWTLDARFASFDAIQMVKNDYPNLSSKAELISYFSGYYSINPFLLSELLLINEGKVSKTAEDLSLIIHQQNSDLKQMNKLLQNKNLNMNKINKSMLKYDIPQRVKSADDDNFPALDMPFNHQESWFFNGIHTWSGDDNGTPMSSIDITKNWNLVWGNVTSSDWIAAAHAGTLTVIASCFVRITHESGWATDYYHLDNVQFNTGDEVKAGEFIANYANNSAQALCDGGASTGPHLHFSLLKNGRRHSLSQKAISNWVMHPGNFSYDSSPDRMWLEKDGQKIFAFQDTLTHLAGDNVIDYRYSGIYSSPEITGHGINISISQIVSGVGDELRNLVFVAFYTYDDNGNANFYAGNVDFDNWRTDEQQTIPMIQTSGGDFSNLNAIDFSSDVVQAGVMNIHFLSCNQVEIDFDLIEPTALTSVQHDLILSKSVGIPDHVCQAPSLLINK